MSLVTQMLVVEKYGIRLSVEQLAELFSISKGTMANLISAGECPVKTYKDGGKRYADYRDVAAHLDECRKSAT